MMFSNDDYSYSGDLFSMLLGTDEGTSSTPASAPTGYMTQQDLMDGAKPNEPAPEPTPEPVKEEPKEEEKPKYEPIFQKTQGKANILVVGVGGGGCNAVNNMVRVGIKRVNFVVMNTDTQALDMSLVPPQCKVQLGEGTTNGLGAGSDPEVGRRAAEESRDHIKAVLQDVDLLFITAGMGGGTGTGAAPVVAEIARSMGILTVGVVTKPFTFEGNLRMKNAELGLQNLRNFVDTLLVIPNQKLIEVFSDRKLTFKQAFEVADDVLRQGVQGVSDVITNPELVNLDFADVRTILSNKGLAHMGIGYGKGENRVLQAVRSAVYSPLVETNIEGATAVIVNVLGGEDMLLEEVNEACEIVRKVVDPNANFIFGSDSVVGKQDIQVTIIATGFTDKRTAPLKAPGTAPTRATKPISSAFAAADIEPKEAPRPAPAPAPAMEYPVRPAVPTPRRPVYDEPSRPTPAPASRSEESRGGVNSSRIDVSSRSVPHFLRRLRNNDDDKK